MPDVFDLYFARMGQSNPADPQQQIAAPGLPGQQRSIDMGAAFAALRSAKLALYESSEKAISTKAALDKKKSELLASDTIQGKNAETREAKLAQECWPEMATLEAAEAEKRKAAHEADQAALVVTELQWLIRNDEATAALVRERII